MTDVNVHAPSVDSRATSALRLPELQARAAALGIVGASKLRKGELVNAINEANDNNTAETTTVIDAPQAAVETAPAAKKRDAKSAGAATSYSSHDEDASSEGTLASDERLAALREKLTGN